MFAKLRSYSPRGILYIHISKPILAGFLLLAGSVSTEEEYIWKDAIVTSPFPIYAITSPLDNLINSTTFKEMVHTWNNDDENQWFRIDQIESLKPITIYIQNRTDGFRN